MKPSLPVDISILAEHNREYPWAKLQAWFMANTVKETMLWKDAAGEQIMFVRDEFYYLFGKDLLETCVVGTHMSKSINLPVYQVAIKGGITLTMRGNFHDWKVTVQSPADLEFPTDLFSSKPDEDIHSCYCEGFTDDQVLPSYGKSKRNFTVEIHSQKYLFVFMFLLQQQVKSRS